MSARGGDDRRRLGVGDEDDVGASRRERWRPLMELHLVRGSSSSLFKLKFTATAAAAADMDAAADPVIVDTDAEVPSKLMAEEMMCLLRAVTRFRLELDSRKRKWRHEMPADEMMRLSRGVGLFRSQLAAALRRQELMITPRSTARRLNPKQLTESEEQQEPERVVACVRPFPYARNLYYDSDDDSDGNSDGNSSDVNGEVLKVDLSFVPNSFWSQSASYTVQAAAHGLVCISNDSEDHRYLARARRSSSKQGARALDLEEEWACAWGPGRPWSNRYCLLNPVTRTCMVLPEPPFKAARWLLPTSTSVAVLGWSDLETVPQTVLSATYNWQSASASAAGGWVSARELVLLCDEGGYCNWPPDAALLDGRAYWYTRHDNRVHHVMAEGEVQVIDGPSVTRLGLHEMNARSCLLALGTYQKSALVAHRGAIFFVAELRQWLHTPAAVCCAVWRLAPSGVDGRCEWEGVACLENAELDRLTRSTCGRVELGDAYGVWEVVCCQLIGMGTQGIEKRLVGFNLETRKWELVCAKPHTSNAPTAFELRPDLFLPS